MRTDVKVGLVCVFVLVVGVIAYFALNNRSRHRAESISPHNQPALTTHDENTGGGSLAIAAPDATALADSHSPNESLTVEALGHRAAAPLSTLPATNLDATAETVHPAGGVVLLDNSATEPADATKTLPPSSPQMPEISPTTPPSATEPGTSTAALAAAQTYIVKKGDVLLRIAHAHHVTLKAIEAANPGIHPNLLHVGQKINIPAVTAKTSRLAAGEFASPAVSDPNLYVVKKGDTLTAIAGTHHTTVKALIAANPGIHPNRLRVGEKIQLSK